MDVHHHTGHFFLLNLDTVVGEGSCEDGSSCVLSSMTSLLSVINCLVLGNGKVGREGGFIILCQFAVVLGVNMVRFYIVAQTIYF